MNSIIVKSKGKDKELNISLYDFIWDQWKYANGFCVCHVTDEEYDLMLRQIKINGHLNESLSNFYLKDVGYNRFRYMAAYIVNRSIIYIADYNEVNKKGYYFIDKKGLQYLDNAAQFPIDHILSSEVDLSTKVYTTETFENFVEYYKEYFSTSIDLDSKAFVSQKDMDDLQTKCNEILDVLSKYDIKDESLDVGIGPISNAKLQIDKFKKIIEGFEVKD